MDVWPAGGRPDCVLGQVAMGLAAEVGLWSSRGLLVFLNKEAQPGSVLVCWRLFDYDTEFMWVMATVGDSSVTVNSSSGCCRLAFEMADPDFLGRVCVAVRGEYRRLVWWAVWRHPLRVARATVMGPGLGFFCRWAVWLLPCGWRR